MSNDHKTIEELFTKLTKVAISETVSILDKQGLNDESLSKATVAIVDNFRSALKKVQSETKLVYSLNTLATALSRLQGLVDNPNAPSEDRDKASMMVVASSIVSMMIRSRAAFEIKASNKSDDIADAIRSFVNDIVSGSSKPVPKSKAFDDVISRIKSVIGDDWNEQLDAILDNLNFKKGDADVPEAKPRSTFDDFKEAFNIAKNLIYGRDEPVDTAEPEPVVTAEPEPVAPLDEPLTEIGAAIRALSDRIAKHQGEIKQPANDTLSFINDDLGDIPDEIKTALREIAKDVPYGLDEETSIEMLKEMVQARLSDKVTIIDDQTVINGVKVRLLRFIIHTDGAERKAPSDNLTIDRTDGIWINSDVVVVTVPASATQGLSTQSARQMAMLQYYNTRVVEQMEHEEFHERMNNSHGYAYLVDQSTNEVYAIDIALMSNLGGEVRVDSMTKIDGTFKSIAVVGDNSEQRQ